MSVYDLLFVTVLIVTASVLLSHLDWTEFLEAGRDYIISRHIVVYHDFPLIGPWNAAYGLLNSPFYFYFLSLFLFIKDNPLFLNIVNIGFQLLTLIFFYVFTRKMFDSRTAFFATIFLGLSTQLVRQARWISQPYVAAPFISACYFLLLWAHTKKNYWSLLLGTMTFTMAATLHNSVFSLLPVMLVVVILIMREHRYALKYYAGILITVFAIIPLLYFPAVIFWNYHGHNPFSVIALGRVEAPAYGNPENAYIESPQQFITNLSSNATVFLNAVFNFPAADVSFHTFAAVAYVLILIYHCVATWRRKTERVFLLLLISAVASPIIFLSLFQMQGYPHHFVLVYGLFAITAARPLSSLLSKNIIGKVAAILLALLYISSFSNNFSIYGAYDLRLWKTVNAAAYSIKNEVISIQKNENLGKTDFFRIKMGDYYEWGWKQDHELIISSLLEKLLNTRISSIANQGGGGIGFTNNDRYVFLACYFYPNAALEEEQCVKRFLFTEDGRYSFVKKSFDERPISIYLTRKNDGR